MSRPDRRCWRSLPVFQISWVNQVRWNALPLLWWIWLGVTTMTQLVAEKLVKAYGQRTVVQNVDFEASRGEIVGLLGPNGAGKTTTFGLIIGLGKPKSGRIFLDGRDITELPMHKRTRLGLGYLPQEPSVFRKLTVEENVQ